LLPERVNRLLYIQINRRTLRRDPLVKVLKNEDENEDEDEDEGDLWTDANEDATFVRPAHTTEALLGEDVPVEASGVGLI
jgi:hypothetical protein